MALGLRGWMERWRMLGEVQGSDRSKVGFLFLVWDVELII